MLKQAITLIGALCFAGQAAALSCLPASVQRTYTEAAAAPEAYVVLLGTLVFDESKLPETSHDPMKLPESAQIPARMAGKVLTNKGFAGSVAVDLTLDVQCLASWCGGETSGLTYLAFLRKQADDYILVSEPCRFFTFANPTREQIEAVEACHAGQPCESPFGH